MNKRRLNKLANTLDKVDEKAFDFGNIGILGDKFQAVMQPKSGEIFKAAKEVAFKGADCGTAGCAVGCMPLAFPKLVEYRPTSPGRFGIRLKLNKRCKDFDAAEKLLDITDADSDYLFEPLSYPDGNRTTAKQVAKRIRKFIAEGGSPPLEHDWWGL